MEEILMLRCQCTIEHRDNYSKRSERQHFKDESNDNIIDSDVEIVVLFKYLRKFWQTFEMPLVNCEIDLILIWPANFIIFNTIKAIPSAITDAKLYVPVVTLSNQDNSKLLLHIN